MKIVRDKIQSRYPQHEYRHATDQEVPTLLLLKLMEEAGEVVSARNDSELLEELGDLLEVMYSIAANVGASIFDIEREREKKLSRLGGFTSAIVMTNYKEKCDG